MTVPTTPLRRPTLSTRALRLRSTLLVALTGALFGVAQAQPASAAGHGTEGPRHAMTHRMDAGKASDPMLHGRMLDAVGASADQKARIHEIMGRAHDDTRQQHQADRALHEQMRALMAAPQIDAAAAEGLRQQMQARRDVASKRHLQAMLDVSAVLTPEQRQKLGEQARSRQDMRQRHHRERESLQPRS